jgi:hypothetical protein
MPAGRQASWNDNHKKKDLRNTFQNNPEGMVRADGFSSLPFTLCPLRYALFDVSAAFREVYCGSYSRTFCL